MRSGLSLLMMMKFGSKKIATAMKKESEKTLEARLAREVALRGGMALKYTSQYHRGIPDRIVLLKGGKTVFVEMKSTGERPTLLQTHAMNRLESMGYECRVIDSTEALTAFLKVIDDEI